MFELKGKVAYSILVPSQDLPVCKICQTSSVNFWGTKNSFDLYQCRTCDLIFVAPLPSQAPALYNESYFRGAKEGFGYVDYERDKIPMRGAFLQYLNEIENIIPARGVMLDVGAATGFFFWNLPKNVAGKPEVLNYRTMPRRWRAPRAFRWQPALLNSKIFPPTRLTR